MRKLLFMLLLLLTICSRAYAQLKPGFDKAEYHEMLRVCAQIVGTPAIDARKDLKPLHHILAYRSEVTALDNRWDLWVHKNGKSAVISLRGTTLKSESWLENFFAAMVPARGKLYLSAGDTFRYKLSTDPKAAVHVGWLIGMATQAVTIVPRIDSCYKSGIKDFVIMGHSQGGAIAYLLRSYLHYLQQKGKLPGDIQFKNYCSAAPKPGNLYYAYDYEDITRNGWGFTVLNSEDWVPETPLSLQTINDYNDVNPFKGAGEMLAKQPFPKNIVLKLVYNSMRRPAARLQRRYKKYLGDQAYKMIKGHMTELGKPEFYSSSNYMRAGTPIILKADKGYHEKFPDSTNIFVHHFFDPYLYLLKQYN